MFFTMQITSEWINLDFQSKEPEHLLLKCNGKLFFLTKLIFESETRESVMETNCERWWKSSSCWKVKFFLNSAQSTESHKNETICKILNHRWSSKHYYSQITFGSANFFQHWNENLKRKLDCFDSHQLKYY